MVVLPAVEVRQQAFDLDRRGPWMGQDITKLTLTGHDADATTERKEAIEV